jgi:hypothetical protein
MEYEKKIEFYQTRSIGERFSATADFLKQTWKVLLKNLLIAAIPFALIIGYSQPYYAQYTAQIMTGNYSNFPPQIVLLLITSFISSLVIYALSASIMIKYGKGELSSTTGWNDLKKTLFSLIGKTGLIYLFLLGFSALAGLFFVILSSLGTGGIVLAFILLILASIAIFPSLTILFYPAYFRNASAWNSIKTGFYLGFKDWGGIFVAILISIVFAVVISVVFSVPYQIFSFFNRGEISLSGFLLASLSSLGNFLTSSFLVIYMAFQYFAVAEKEEGISMQSQIDEFDRL